VSKVSFWTVAMQALMSGYLCGIYLVTAIILGIFIEMVLMRKYCCAVFGDYVYGFCVDDV
jgi:hypothetical protein